MPVSRLHMQEQKGKPSLNIFSCMHICVMFVVFLSSCY